MGPRPFSRGYLDPVHQERHPYLASMGPRPFSRGYMLIATFRMCATSRFNGATAFQPWICAVAPSAVSRVLLLQWGHGLSAVDIERVLPSFAIIRLLQWGHGLSAVDICWKQRPRHRLLVASMGPRPFSRGYGLKYSHAGICEKVHLPTLDLSLSTETES